MKSDFPPLLSNDDVNSEEKRREQNEYFQKFYETQYPMRPDLGVFVNEE